MKLPQMGPKPIVLLTSRPQKLLLLRVNALNTKVQQAGRSHRRPKLGGEISKYASARLRSETGFIIVKYSILKGVCHDIFSVLIFYLLKTLYEQA